MSGEQNKLSVAPTRNHTSSARPLDEPANPRGNRPTDVDAIVSDFLLELNSLSKPYVAGEDPRSRPEVTTIATSAPAPEPHPPEVPAPSEALLPVEAEDAPNDLETTLAATLDALEREQSNVVHLTSRERIPVEIPGVGKADTPRAESAAAAESPRTEEFRQAAPSSPQIQSAAEQIGAVPLPAQDSARPDMPDQSRAEQQVVSEMAPEQPPSAVGAGSAEPPVPGQDAELVQAEPAIQEVAGGPEIAAPPQTEAEPALPAEPAQKSSQASEEALDVPVIRVRPVKKISPDAQKAQPEPDYILRGIYEERRHKKRMLVIQLIVIVVILVLGLTFGYFFVQSRSGRPGSAPIRSSVEPPSEQIAQPADSSPPPSLTGEDRASGADSRDNSTLAGQATAARADAREIPAEPIKKVLPPYPTAAKGQKIFGKVELEVEVQVDEKGNVVLATAVNGPAVFRGDAEKALMKWLFKPALREGAPVPSTVRIPVVFNPQ
jgi:periplasmic protein TonB